MRKNKVKSTGFFVRICNCRYLQLQQNLHYVDLKLRILKKILSEGCALRKGVDYVSALFYHISTVNALLSVCYQNP